MLAFRELPSAGIELAVIGLTLFPQMHGAGAPIQSQ